MKRASEVQSASSNAKKARQQCHQHFQKYAKQILDEQGESSITPDFTAESAYSFFSEVYGTGHRNFVQPSWMPTPPPPEVEMNCSPITAAEVTGVLKRMRSRSAPSPFDRVGYVVFKKCPSLIPILVHLFNLCWSQSIIPQEWKVAAIRLISKGSACQNPCDPGNFRPIALTPCIGKLFTSLLRNRWLQFMLSNRYLDPSLQKAFMPTVPGCIEHQFKLSSLIAEAQSKHKSLAVCWLDLANAYGSVHHALIQFSLQHYYAPPQFLSTLQALYSGLSATIMSDDWETPLIPLEKGVYQGDPLSVVIFNTVMNTLVDTIATRSDLGYQFSRSSRRVNILQYADDTCLVANSPATCQYLLLRVSDWLRWSGMAAKVPKCQCMSLQASTGLLKDPQLHLNGVPIPFTLEPVRFLGRNVHVRSTTASSKDTILSKLISMMKAVDRTLTTRRQKLLLFSGAVCPRLTWPLLIQEFSTTWVEKQLDSITTRYLKRW